MAAAALTVLQENMNMWKMKKNANIAEVYVMAEDALTALQENIGTDMAQINVFGAVLCVMAVAARIVLLENMKNEETALWITKNFMNTLRNMH